MSTSRQTRWRDEVNQDGRPTVAPPTNGRADDVVVAADGLRGSDAVTLPELGQLIVEGLDGRAIQMDEFLHGRLMLYPVDDRSTPDHRMVAEIAWIEERLDPGVRFVLVWSRRPVRLTRLSPARQDTLSVIDTTGGLSRLLECSGRRKTLIIDAATGTIERASKDSAVFSLGREIRETDARGSDHVIDLGDLT